MLALRPCSPRPLLPASQVSDILFTGGDPMFMKTRLIKEYFEPFKDPTFLPHIKNLRIGTRALTFWPQRFTTDDDADAIEAGLRGVVAGLIDEAHVLALDQDAATMARDLDDRLCCPRDLGAPAAAAIRRLAALYE